MITTKQLQSKLDEMTAKSGENAYIFIKVGKDAYKVVGEDFVNPDDGNVIIAPRVYSEDDEIWGAELANLLKNATFAL